MNKQSLNFYTIVAILFLNTTLAFGQCVVCVDAPPLITCGETATLTGDGFLTSAYEDNFNNGIGALWNSVSTGGTTTSTCTGGSSVSTINCAGTGSVPAGDFLWFPAGSVVARQATTIPIPVPAGGDIIFEFKMEGQGGSCDGPDLIGEGTMLQYRVGGAAIWQDVPAAMWPFSLNPMPYTNKAYFCPTNPALQSFTSWNQYTVPIPAAAFSAATQFRWRQISPTSQQWDFWGIDNVNISPSSPGGATYVWTTATGPPTAGQTLIANPTSSTNYTFTYTNNGISCNTIVAVNVAPPVVTPSIIINPLNPCPNTIDLSSEASFNTCNYKVYLYDNGGDGWTTVPQTSTSIDNRIEVYVDGILVNTITMNNGYGPFVYSFPVTSGGTFETKFLSGGPNPAECAYFVEDNQGQLITDVGGNIISAMGLITSPSSPFWPVPGGIPPSGGFVIVPNDFGPITTVCPTTNPYTYSWSAFPGGSTAGITTPTDPTTIVAVSASPQDYEVCITDQLNPGCIGCSTITVPGNPSIGTFDFSIISTNPLCNDGLTSNITFELSSTSIFSGNFNFDFQEVDAGGGVLSTTPFTFTTSPYIFNIPIPNSSGTFNYQVVNLLDASGCPITVNLPNPLSLTLNDPPNAGTNIINPIALCKNDIANFYLPNNLTGTPDLNGTWSFLGAGTPDPTLPFIGFNYTLDPALFPATAIGTFHTFQYVVSPEPGCPTPSINTILVSIEDAPTAGILPVNSIQICLDGTVIDLNSLFNSTTACPSCIQPSPFSGTNWTDVTNGTPGTTINTPATWTPIASGTYTIRYTADVSVNCPSTDFEEITIIVSDIPTATFSTNAIADEACLNDNVNLIFSPTGLGNFQIQYFDPGGTSNLVTVDINSNDIGTGLPISIPTNVAGTFNYSIQNIVDLGTGATACTGSAYTDVNLLVTDPPQSGTTTSNTICEDDFTLHNLNNPPFFPTGGDAGGAWTYGMNPVTSGLFQASDNLGNINDPFGAYTYTVTDVLGICPDEFTNITITAETPPNTGIANTNIEICVNDISITNYDLFGLLDGSQGITGSWVHNGIVVVNPIDLTSPIFDLGTPAISTAFSFTYQLVPAPLSFCTNNGSLPYSTNSNITIHPEPKIDPTTPTANPLTVFQTLSTNIFVNMLEGTPPFTVNLLGNETPLGIYLPFVINPGMSGSGPVTPNYDINNNPVTISITSITDGNNCTSIPVGATVDVTVEPFPIITASSSNIEQCEGLPLDIIFEGIQGIPTIDIDFLINGTTYYTATSALNGITILNTPTSSDISSLLSIGSNLIQVINVVDAGGNICPNSLLPPNFTIIINENPSFSNFSSNSPICENENAEISFNINSGLAPFTIDYNYSISSFPLSPPLSQITCNTTHMEVLQLLPEDYTFFITSFTDDNGCIGILPPNINLIVNETPIITLNSFIPSEICEGNTIPLNLQTPINLSTPAVPYTLVINGTDSYLINNNATIFSGPNIGNLITYTENNPGIYPFIITEFYDDNGCGIIDPANNSATLTVNESADMIVTSTADTGEICQGDLAYINFEFTNGTAPWEVTFIKNGIPIILPPYNNSITIPQSLYTYNTSYDIISLKDAKGCNKDPFDKDFEIIANPLPIAELYTDDRFICDDGSTTEMMFTINSGTPAYNVSYSIGLENNFLNINTNSTPLALNTNRAGIWQITEVVDSKGCIADEKGNKITISLNPSPFASFVAYPQPTDVNNPFVNFIDNSIGHSNAVWNFYDNITNDTIINNLKFIHEFSAIADTHLVTLNIISDSGCVSSITQSIFINEAFSCFIPSGFTPNNDLYNDHFLPITRGVTDYKLSIYDRLGSRVFETNKYTDMYCMYGCDQAWDGKINNSSEYAPTGNYVYNIVIIDFNGKERVFDGTVNLIR
jgi:gliding motility-associated-like protein